jgi:hypothetical protein
VPLPVVRGSGGGLPVLVVELPPAVTLNVLVAGNAGSVDDSAHVVLTGMLLKVQLRDIGKPSYVFPAPPAPLELSATCPAEYTL